MTIDALADLRARWRTTDAVPGYRLVNLLGAGAQGLCFTAIKLAIGRTYVVKFLRRPECEVGVPAHELEHLALLAELRHPNLVQVEDRGEAFGLPYLVLDYAGDRTLRTWLAGPEVELGTALRFVDETAAALHYLHRKGVLHLDVKPSNIFIHDDHARLGDFGVIEPLHTTGPARLDRPVGTEPYVAPEVVAEGRATPAADVHGLGRVLDDIVIRTAARDDAHPAPSLVALVTAATAQDPAARPTLPAFRESLKAAATHHPRRVTFVSTPPLRADTSPGRGRPVRFRSIEG